MEAKASPWNVNMRRYIQTFPVEIFGDFETIVAKGTDTVLVIVVDVAKVLDAKYVLDSEGRVGPR